MKTIEIPEAIAPAVLEAVRRRLADLHAARNPADKAIKLESARNQLNLAETVIEHQLKWGGQ